MDAGDGYEACPATPSGGRDVCESATFSFGLPVASRSSVDFGLLVDVYRTATGKSNMRSNRHRHVVRSVPYGIVLRLLLDS